MSAPRVLLTIRCPERCRLARLYPHPDGGVVVVLARSSLSRGLAREITLEFPHSESNDDDPLAGQRRSGVETVWLYDLSSPGDKKRYWSLPCRHQVWTVSDERFREMVRDSIRQGQREYVMREADEGPEAEPGG